MRDAILTWVNNYTHLNGSAIQGLDAIRDGVEDLMCLVDDPLRGALNNNSCPSVMLIASDYGGNLTMPWYGRERPSQDYYSSNLSLYAFIITSLSTGAL
jgi:hypothetical protein